MDLTGSSLPTPLQELTGDFLSRAGVRLFVKRDDLIHPEVSGNKWRKLKYNLLHARETGHRSLLTFGGAYSNHLYALAAAGNAMGFQTIGIVRGENFGETVSHTLQFCRENGMQLHFLSREKYRLRNDPDFIRALLNEFCNPFFIPEGGSSAWALPGVAEMVDEVKNQLGALPDYFAVAAGTGGTAAGILSAGANVLAFSALKGGDFLQNDIRQLLNATSMQGELRLFTHYHFGGYAKWSPELLAFMDHFHDAYDIRLEQVYTAKMFAGLFNEIREERLKNCTIVAVHTGGLQGLLRN